MISQSVKQAIKKAKHYYLTLILSLSLTLSMVFTVFSIVDAIFLQPLPYSDADEIYHVKGLIDYEGKLQDGTNPPGLFHVKVHSNQIDEMAIYFTLGEQKVYSLPSRPDTPVFFASPDFFTLLQVEPKLGRFFNEQEALGNKQPSAILSFQAWQNLFAGDREIIGKKIQLEQRSYTIVGIAPDHWTLPNFDDVSQAIWLPQDMSDVDPEHYTGFTSSFAALIRPKPGKDVAAIMEEIAPLYYKGSELSLPQYTKMLSPVPQLTPLTQAIRGDSGKIVLMLALGALLLIFIALVNLGNLQMARAASRVQPLAISYAFGATHRQIFKELFRHNLFVSGVSAVLGLLLTTMSFSIVKNIGDSVLPRLNGLHISLYMLFFSILLALLIAVLFSWIEMQSARETNLRASLQSSGKGTGKQMKKGVSHFLIGLQLFFSVVTLVATSQVLHTTLAEAMRPTQIEMENLWNIKVNFSAIESKEERINLNRAIMTHFAAQPEIEAVSFSSEMRVDSVNRNFIYNENNEQIASVRRILVDEKQLSLFGMENKGRAFTKEDSALEYSPVIINQRLADYFPDDPIGKKIILDDKKPHEIIGIVSNTDYPGASYREDGEVFIPSDYIGDRTSVILMRYRPELFKEDNEALLSQLLKIDPRLDLTEGFSVEQQFSLLSKNQRFAAYIAGALSAISLLMVVAGILGMVSYMVNIRRYDMGVKMAMGATNSTLMKGQLAELSLPLGAAILFAFSVVVFALGYSRTQPNWLFDIQWHLVVVTLTLLFTIAAIASFVPTLKILNTNPIKALRND